MSEESDSLSDRYSDHEVDHCTRQDILRGLRVRSTTLPEGELAFLRKLQTGNWRLKEGKTSPRIQSLVDRGYCRVSPERLGPLGVYTGEFTINLTEAGAAVLNRS